MGTVARGGNGPMKESLRKLRVALSPSYEKASESVGLDTKLDRSQIDLRFRKRGDLVQDTHPCPVRSVHKLFSGFVTKQSFKLRCGERLLMSPAKISCAESLPKGCDPHPQAVYSSGPTRSQSVDRFDCMAMWELKRN